MVQVATDDRLWQELHQRSLDRASQFSWAKTAAQTQAVLRQLF
jgi:hypothetical protein